MKLSSTSFVRMRWMIVILTGMMVINVDPSIKALRTSVVFLEENNMCDDAFGDVRRVESCRRELSVDAEEIPSATTLETDGFVHISRDMTTYRFITMLARSCFSSGRTESDEIRTRFDRFLLDHEQDARTFSKYLERDLSAYLSGRSLSCVPPEKFVLFTRSSHYPQNAHYDTVAAESKSCATMTPESVGTVRVWMPLDRVRSAPLMISNTTNLYDNACARRSPDVPGMSSSWKIPSRDAFVSDCAERRSLLADARVCRWYHTLGMDVGEKLAFRNGMVMHGTPTSGDVGRELRVSVAIDCVVTDDTV